MSFVLSMNDIDFSRNKTMEGMLHWLVWNIPADATGLPEGVPMGQLQNGAYQISASGQMYRAPVGPGRKHHYIFELMALDTKLDVQPGSDPFDTRAKVFAGSQGHILGKIAWVTTFGPNDATPGPIQGGGGAARP
jgi:Raf kinase inhibitor-like YbhB/YbcL family protein